MINKTVACCIVSRAAKLDVTMLAIVSLTVVGLGIWLQLHGSRAYARPAPHYQSAPPSLLLTYIVWIVNIRNTACVVNVNPHHFIAMALQKHRGAGAVGQLKQFSLQ